MRLFEGIEVSAAAAGESLFGPSGSILTGVLLFSGTVTAGLLALYGVLYSQRAPLQTVLNDAFTGLTKELQLELAALRIEIVVKTARISELEAELLRQRGQLRQSEQREDSLTRLLERSGMSLVLDHTAEIKTKDED